MPEDLFGFGVDPEAEARKEAWAALDAKLQAADPSRNSRAKQAWANRPSQRPKTFRITKLVDPISDLKEEVEPWAHEDKGALRTELKLAWRLIAMLVDKTPASAVKLSPSELRQVTGRESILMELIMRHGTATDGGETLGLAVEFMPPPDPQNITP